MEKAFAAKRVDTSIPGDREDVQIQLGLLDERLTPAPHYVRLPDRLGPDRRQPTQAGQDQQGKDEGSAARRQWGKRKAQRKRQKEARRKQRKGKR
jgi:hypothetical protein